MRLAMESRLKLTKHLPVHVRLELGHPLLAHPLRLRRVDDLADGVDRLLVDQQLQLDQMALAPPGLLVVERRVTLARSRVSRYRSSLSWPCTVAE